MVAVAASVEAIAAAEVALVTVEAVEVEAEVSYLTCSSLLPEQRVPCVRIPLSQS